VYEYLCLYCVFKNIYTWNVKNCYPLKIKACSCNAIILLDCDPLRNATIFFVRKKTQLVVASGTGNEMKGVLEAKWNTKEHIYNKKTTLSFQWIVCCSPTNARHHPYTVVCSQSPHQSQLGIRDLLLNSGMLFPSGARRKAMQVSDQRRPDDSTEQRECRTEWVETATTDGESSTFDTSEIKYRTSTLIIVIIIGICYQI
jgi:hypothetical protein